MSEIKRRRLFRAEWREIVVVNFEIDPKILAPYTPPKTEIDFFNGIAFVSLIARTVKKVKPGNYPIFFSRPFEQIQLRFYVKRTGAEGERRGICLIKDYLPKRKLSLLMNRLFKHSFTQVPIQHDSTNFESTKPDDLPSAEYRWQINDHWNHIKVVARSQMRHQQKETKESFVLDHHWGYTQNSGKTFEYYVEYPTWAMWDAQSGSFECDTEQVFGRRLLDIIFKDYLPKRKLSLLMNRLFKHSFTQVPIQHDSTNFESTKPDDLPSAEYRWQINDHWNHIKVVARSQMRHQQKETKESFVLDHHWGYTQNSGKTFEYYVEYPTWAMWDAQSGSFECDTEQVFGRRFVKTLRQRPASVFLARGSEVTIYHPNQI